MSPAILNSWSGAAVEWFGFQLLYSTVLAAVIMIALRLLRVRAPLVREAAWSLVLLRLLVPPGWEFPYSLRALLEGWISATAVRESRALVLPVGGSRSGELAGASWSPSWQLVAVVVWVLVAAGLTLALVRRMRLHSRICRSAVLVDDRAVVEMAEAWRQRLRVRRRVGLVASNASSTPFTVGSFRPVIFLPQRVLTWERAAVESIVAHEMAHIRRWDELRILVANLVRIIHFVSPVAWLTVLELAQAREEICDEMVVAGGAVTAQVYSRTLADILRLSRRKSSMADVVVGLVERKEGIAMRVLSIQRCHGRKPVRPWSVALGFLVGAMLMVPMAPAQRSVPANQEAASEVGSDDVPMKGVVDFGFAPIDAVDRLPLAFDAEKPEFPAEAVARRITGVVKLEVTVDAAGALKNVTVAQEVAGGLTEAALAAVRMWRFRPALLGERPVECTMLVFVEFRLVDATPLRVDSDLLAELSPLQPEGITLTGITTDGALIHAEGLATGHELIGEFLGRLETSPRFAHPDLESMTRQATGFHFRLNCERNK